MQMLGLWHSFLRFFQVQEDLTESFYVYIAADGPIAVGTLRPISQTSHETISKSAPTSVSFSKLRTMHHHRASAVPHSAGSRPRKHKQNLHFALRASAPTMVLLLQAAPCIKTVLTSLLSELLKPGSQGDAPGLLHWPFLHKYTQHVASVLQPDLRECAR